MDICTKSSVCCCGQECFEYYQEWNSNTTNQTYLCQCETNRWWNNDIQYCRELFKFLFEFFFSNFDIVITKIGLHFECFTPIINSSLKIQV